MCAYACVLCVCVCVCVYMFVCDTVCVYVGCVLQNITTECCNIIEVKELKTVLG